MHCVSETTPILIIFLLLEEYKPATMTSTNKIGIILLSNRNDKVIPQNKSERYNIIEVNDNAD